MPYPFLFLCSVVLGFALSACSLSGSVTDGAPDASSSAASQEAQLPGEARVIRMEVSNWAFTPSVISAKVGEKVVLQLVGVSGVHGIEAKDLGLNVAIDQGQTVSVNLPTDKAGTFPFRCSVPCGTGHNDMVGMIVVQ